MQSSRFASALGFFRSAVDVEMSGADNLDNKNVRVVHLIRSVGPTSMPWNDLYAIARRLAPGMMYPSAVIGFGWGAAQVRWIECRDRKRRYFACNPISGFIYVRKLYQRSLSRGSAMVIHIHNPSLSLLGLLIKLACPRIGVIGNLHSDWSNLKFHHKLGLNLLVRISHFFITVSHASKASIPDHLRERMAKEGRLLVILNGIDSRRMGEYISRATCGLGVDSKSSSPTEVVAIVAARMVPAKNCLFILRLLAETRIIDRLIWFGDGIQRKEIEAEIIRLGIGPRVVLRGRCPREEVFQALADGTLYIAASKWEGIGVANLEAAALGCWPFLSAIPPHGEIAEALDISTYPLNDMGAWTRAIEAFLALPADERQHKRQKLADAARHSYDLDVSVAKYIEIYGRLQGE